jgi:hypothetical protein
MKRSHDTASLFQRHAAKKVKKKVVFCKILVKTKLKNKMGDSLLDDCLTYIEWDIFLKVDDDDIIGDLYVLKKT